MISVAIPYHSGMHDAEYFLKRCIASVESQKHVDYEIVVTDNPNGWSANHNEAIKKCKGDIIKFLHMDDFLTHPDSLQRIVDNFKGGWLVTGCVHCRGGQDRFNTHIPEWTDDISTGNNRIGGPSVLTIENNDPILFDEELTWLVDCEYYTRLHKRYGPPTILESAEVVIGIHDGQATNIISGERKAREVELMKQRNYDTI